MEKVNLKEEFVKFSDLWSPKIDGEINDSYVKLAKFKGEFTWHKHDNEDEMFLVVKGELLIKFRDKDVVLNEGEFIVVPKGVEHLPVAKEGFSVLLEPKSVLNTGDVVNERTVAELEWV